MSALALIGLGTGVYKEPGFIGKTATLTAI
jgi:hypothetical protein